jgi:hypothetical protein
MANENDQRFSRKSPNSKRKKVFELSAGRQGWISILACFCFAQLFLLRPGKLSSPQLNWYDQLTGAGDSNVTVSYSFLAKQDATIAQLKKQVEDLQKRMTVLQTDVNIMSSGIDGNRMDAASLALMAVEDTIADVEKNFQFKLAPGSHNFLAQMVMDLKAQQETLAKNDLEGRNSQTVAHKINQLFADIQQLERDWHLIYSMTNQSATQHLVEIREEKILGQGANKTEYRRFTHSINPLLTFDDNERKCFEWTVSYDEWLTHHVEFYVSQETDKFYCIERRKDPKQIEILQQLYHIQFRMDCSRHFSKEMWSSGWGADILSLLDGLAEATRTKDPFVPMNNPWHYAAKRDGSRYTCREKTMACYFLPISRCIPSRQRLYTEPFHDHSFPNFLTQPWRLYTEYLTRPQTWLRKAVYDFSKSIQLSEPCSIIHVRRADIILHEEFARKYFPIEAYLNATEKITNTIFLITDDDNAVIEARKKYPDKNWVVIERPRFKGAEGGWENQVPSDDPLLEVLVLMTIFRLAGRCQVFVHSQSNLSDYILGILKTVRGESNFTEVNLSKMKGYGEVFSENNTKTQVLSRADW